MAVRQGGREAVTHWEVLTLWHGGRASRGGREKHAATRASRQPAPCRLETGRTHQIRVHLASIGHPLLGDEVYGTGFRTKSVLLPQQAQVALKALGKQALHAHILSVKHPTSAEILRFRSELPPDLARLRRELAAMQADSGEK